MLRYIRYLTIFYIKLGMRKKTILSFTVILTFLGLRYLNYFLGYVIFGKESWNALDESVALAILNYSKITIVLIVTALLFRKMPFEFLGLKKDLLKGLGLGFLFSLPMFIGYAFQANFQSNLSFGLFHRDMVMAGFYEEFMYRGFLFGLLFYYGGWGFVSASLIPAIFFGIGHLYQADTLTDSLGVFLFTALGSVGFAWFYVAWRSLWMVIFLHGFMDLAWDMFSIQTNVTGDWYANLFRFATLGLVIFFSVKKAKKDGHYSLEGRLWFNKSLTEEK